MNKNFHLFIAVDSDEETMLGIIDTETYDKWNSGDIKTSSNDHFSLFDSEHTTKVADLEEALMIVAKQGGKIDKVLGAVAY